MWVILLLNILQAQDNIKMVPMDIGCQEVVLIPLARDTDLCSALLNAALNSLYVYCHVYEWL
jgi:hypothetical protein